MVRWLRPILLTGLLALAAWILARSPLPTVSAQSGLVGSGPNRAGLVIRFDDGRIEKRCVAFSDPEIGGDELLQLSGINDVVIAPEGTVCRLDGKGCPSDDCFCQCPFPNCEYWAYYHRENGAWEYSQLGAPFSVIADGDLDGWSWGQGDFQDGIEPPQLNFEDVCPAASTDATPTPTPTTQSGAVGSPPQVSFYAAVSTVTTGQCTTLTWQTTDAVSVTLEGASVPFQGSQQACPTATQSWTLVATNAAGQTSRQVTVAVQAASSGAAPTALPTATPTSAIASSPTARATIVVARLGSPTSSVRTPRPIITQAPLPNATVSGVLPQPTLDLQGGGVPLAPTAEPPPVVPPTPVLTPTRFEFSLPPTETPRPRRVLNPDAPTPTPLLVARADVKPSGGSAAAAAARAASQPSAGNSGGSTSSAQSRAFTPTLLPGYAAYIASMAVLLIMGWYVLRRRHPQAPVRSDE